MSREELVEEIMKASLDYPDVVLYMETLMKSYEKLEEENKKVKNNWNELKGYCKEKRKLAFSVRVSDLEPFIPICDILNKMEELEGNNNE